MDLPLGKIVKEVCGKEGIRSGTEKWPARGHSGRVVCAVRGGRLSSLDGVLRLHDAANLYENDIAPEPFR